MGRFADFIRTPLGFLGSRPQKEELVAEYVIREHHSGRTLAEILEDSYVTNRLPHEQAARLLDRSDVIHAVGEDTIAAHRAAS